MRGPFAAAAPAALLPCMLHCSTGAAIRAGASLSVLLGCTAGGATTAAVAAAAASRLLPSTVSRALQSLAAAQHLLNLRSLHSNSSCPAPLQRRRPPCLPGAAAAQQLVSLRGFYNVGSQSSGCRSSSSTGGGSSASPVWHPAAAPTLTSLCNAHRSTHAAAGTWLLHCR